MTQRRKSKYAPKETSFKLLVTCSGFQAPTCNDAFVFDQDKRMTTQNPEPKAQNSISGEAPLPPLDPRLLAAMYGMQEEDEIKEIARLVGMDSLSDRDRLILETARSLREDFLHQNAFHEIDTYCSINKQYKIIKSILEFGDKASKQKKIDTEKIIGFSCVADIAHLKYKPEKEFDLAFEKVIKKMSSEFDSYTKKNEVSSE